MTKWYEQAYLLTLEYSHRILRNYTRANGFNSRECFSADFAIEELLNRFEEPYCEDPLMLVYDYQRQLNYWGAKCVQKGEMQIANTFLVEAEVIRNLADYISAPLEDGMKGEGYETGLFRDS